VSHESNGAGRSSMMHSQERESSMNSKRIAALFLLVSAWTLALSSCDVFDKFGNYVYENSQLCPPGQSFVVCNARSADLSLAFGWRFTKSNLDGCGAMKCGTTAQEVRDELWKTLGYSSDPGPGAWCQITGKSKLSDGPVLGTILTNCLLPASEPECAKVGEPCDSIPFVDMTSKDPKRKCCGGLVCSDVSNGYCCVEQGSGCSTSSDCCDTTTGCENYVCGCTPIGAACQVSPTTGLDSCCLPADCVNGQCCLVANEVCDTAAECCSGSCSLNLCD